MTTTRPEPTAADRRRWARYLAEERAEAQVYRDLARRRDGEERDILLALADAEGRHEQHWLDLLGEDIINRDDVAMAFDDRCDQRAW